MLPAPPEPASMDVFGPYRRRPKRSFWMLGLQPVEAGDLLSPENHARVLELLPEDGIALPCTGARGELVLLVSIPEEQLGAFAEGEWRVGHRFEENDRLVLALWVGVEGQPGPPASNDAKRRVFDAGGEIPGPTNTVSETESLRQSPLECPFIFDLTNEEQVQGAIQLTERQEVDFYGLTHMEEGLMLTLKGSVELPPAFRQEVKGDLLEKLAGMGGGE